MQKRGQFYLIAAIVIIVALFGITAVTNFVVTKPDSIKFYDINRELSLESESVINFGIANDEEIDALLEEFTQDYATYITEGDSDIFFIYGNEEFVKVVAYTIEDQGGISLIIGGSDPIEIDIEGGFVNSSNIPVGSEGDVLVNIGDDVYPFNINEGQNFFFVVKDSIDGG